MNSHPSRRRNRVWILVATGWLALAGFAVIGARAPAAKSSPPRAASTQPLAGVHSVADGWITTKVKATYAYSRWIDGSDIMVDTIDGIVKLTGSTHSSAERELAIELAQNIRGVREVDASGLKAG